MRLRVVPLVAALLATTACVPEPVSWEEDLTREMGTLSDTLRLSLAADGAPRLTGAWAPPAWPDEPGVCRATRRAARAAVADTVYASWFQVRADSSVLLRVARSDDGGRTWDTPVTADSMDAGRAGCTRPVPFLDVDPLNGYVQLAYHLDAREGAGLFFVHSMTRGTVFEQPMPIVYGDRPSEAVIASRGDTVLVAYEDPNSRLPRLGLALSRTAGHIFESRLAASDATGEARTPRIALRGDEFVLAWTATQRGGGASYIAFRRGTLTW
jgi:hypothetical protein